MFEFECICKYIYIISCEYLYIYSNTKHHHHTCSAEPRTHAPRFHTKTKPAEPTRRRSHVRHTFEIQFISAFSHFSRNGIVAASGAVYTISKSGCSPAARELIYSKTLTCTICCVFAYTHNIKNTIQ